MPLPRLREPPPSPPPSPGRRGIAPARLVAAVAAALAALGLAASAATAGAAADASEGWGPTPRQFSIEEVIELIRSGKGPVLIDSRSHAEYLRGHVPTALNVPHKETWGRIDELRRFADRGIIFYCQKGARSGIAAKGLLLEGFPKIGMMQGHFEEWKRRGLPVER